MTRKKITLITGLILALMVVVVSAANYQVRGASSSSIYPSGNYIDMKTTMSSGMSGTLIKNIETSGDFFMNGVIMTSLRTSDMGGVPSKSLTYAVGAQSAWYELAGYGWYVTTTSPNDMYYDSSNASYIHNQTTSTNNEVLSMNNEETVVTESSDTQMIKEDYANFFNELNNHIAMTHGIALNEYRQVDIFNLEESEDNFYLTKLYFNLPDIDVGDKKPTVFLKNDKEGIVLTQKADGKNVVYYIEDDPVDSWKVKNKKVAQGKLMTFKIKKNK